MVPAFVWKFVTQTAALKHDRSLEAGVDGRFWEGTQNFIAVAFRSRGFLYLNNDILEKSGLANCLL